jgi:pimeloyl-ACP methyl ester carboxylesterase
MSITTLPARPPSAGTEFSPNHIATVHELNPRIELHRVTDTASIAGATVSYDEAWPADPDDYTDDTPLVVLPGYLGVRDAYLPFAEKLAGHGRHVALESSARAQSTAGFFDFDNRLHPERLTSKSAYAVIRAVLQRGFYEEVDVVAHSMMAPMILPVVERLLAGRVRSLVLVDPIEDLGVRGMASGYIRSLLQDALPNCHDLLNINGSPSRLIRDGAYHLFRNAPQTVAEINFARRAAVRPGLLRLAETTTRVALLAHRDDPLAPGVKCLQKFGGLVDAAACEDGGHLQLQLDPAGSARRTIDLLDQLNEA